jgi:heavy metal sensor kinase
MKLKLTIKTRLTLWYIIILTMTLIAFSSFIFINVEQYIYKQVEIRLKNQGEQIIGEIENSDLREESIEISPIINEVKENADKDFLIAYYASNKKLVSTNKQNDILPDKLKADNTFSTIELENDNLDEDWALITLPINSKSSSGWIRVAESLDSEEKILDKLILISILGISIFLIAAITGGYFLAGKALSPIEKINTTARDISSSNLGQRVEKKNTDDEVGSLIITLNQLFARLEKAFEREKQFTSDASHELRTPITVIRAQSEKILRRKDLNEECKETMKIIKKQSDYMGHLIEQLLLLARSDSGKQIIEKEQFDIHELVEIVAGEFRAVAENENIKIITEQSRETLSILADQSMIIQLLLNLMDNAIKYTPEGGEVEIITGKRDEKLIIKIKDTGRGIPKEEQDNIFKRFYRVDKSRSRKKGGTGLGLAICEWIVESHEGSIEFESRTGIGTTFIIKLPVF